MNCAVNCFVLSLLHCGHLSFWGRVADSAQDAELNAIAGNTISVPTVTAFAAVLLATGRLKNPVERASRPMPLPLAHLPTPTVIWIGCPRATTDPAGDFDSLLPKEGHSSCSKGTRKRPAASVACGTTAQRPKVQKKIESFFFSVSFRVSRLITKCCRLCYMQMLVPHWRPFHRWTWTLLSLARWCAGEKAMRSHCGSGSGSFCFTQKCCSRTPQKLRI